MRENRAIAVGLVLALAVAFAAREMRLRAMDHYLATQPYEDIYYLPPAHWLRVLSLGHDEALADLVWTRALVYFGDELVARGAVAHVFDYAEAIVTLDPDFKAPYRWAAIAGTYRPVETSLPDMYRAADYLTRAVEQFPDDGELAWELGATLMFEIAPLVEDAREKRRLRARGVAYLETATRLGAGPDWLVFTNTTALERLGQTDQAIRHLEEMHGTVRDPAVRAQIELELSRLRGAAYAEAFRAAHEDLEQRRLRELPYVDPGLYSLLGSRSSELIDDELD